MDMYSSNENLSDGSGSGGGNDTCDDGGASLYVQIVGTVLFVLVWPFIVLDMRWFPLGRPAAALVGAVFMVVFQVSSQDQVYEIEGDQENLQTIFLLVGMMILSYYFDREGLLRIVSLRIFGKNKPFWSILWKVCLLSAGLSAFITNDATCLVLTPLLLAEFKKQGRNEKELLPLTLGIATSANIGSASTIFGNPQNAFIASIADVTLIDFFIAQLPAALLGLAINIALLYLFFIKTVLGKHPAEHAKLQRSDPLNDVEADNAELTLTISEQRQSLALSYDQSDQPHLSSQAARERESIYRQQEHTRSLGSSSSQHDQAVHRGQLSSGLHLQVGPHLQLHDSSSAHADQGKVSIVTIDEECNTAHVTNGEHMTTSGSSITDSARAEGAMVEEEVNQVRGLKERTIREIIFIVWLVFISIVMVVLLAIPPPPVVQATFNLGCIPVGAAILTMLVDTIVNKKYAYDAMLKIDWTVILMFMGLFVWIAGFQNTCFPNQLFTLLRPYMNLLKVDGVLLFTVFIMVGSNILSNVPLVILIVHQIPQLCGDETCQGPLGGLLLAWVATIAGNFTLIGSIANLIVAEKARSSVDFRLTFWKYLRFGLWSTIIILFVPLPVVYFLGGLAPG